MDTEEIRAMAERIAVTANNSGNGQNPQQPPPKLIGSIHVDIYEDKSVDFKFSHGLLPELAVEALLSIPLGLFKSLKNYATMLEITSKATAQSEEKKSEGVTP